MFSFYLRDDSAFWRIEVVIGWQQEAVCDCLIEIHCEHG